MPALVGRSKKVSFDYIKERVWKMLQGWEEKLLSQARREILIKAMVQAIPTYTMSCFKLSLRLCSDLESCQEILVETEGWYEEDSLGEGVGDV